jgi:valyl-tRNA synthetase
MHNSIKKPNPAHVLAEVKQQNQRLKTAVKDIRKSFASVNGNTNKTLKAALSAEKKKLAEAKKAGRAAVWSETKALAEYEIFMVKDTAARVLHGVQAVVRSLKSTFNTGYNGPTCIVPPKSTVKLQDKPASDQPQPKT